MSTILHLNSSSNLKSAITRQIGGLAMERLKAQNPGAIVIERDLVKLPVPHVSPEFLGAMFAGDDKAEELKLSNQLIDELFRSDIIVIEAPMYNFSIPSVLKAWVDHIARAKKTFRYTADGPEGLLKGKKAVLILSSGGVYSDGPAKAMDFEATYLRSILNFIGIADIETIRVEGTGMGGEKSAASVAQARQQAGSLMQQAV